MFRTEVDIETQDSLIRYGDNMLFIGSCFSEEIGKRMIDFKFAGMINPFGIVYNPASIARGLDQLITEKKYQVQDLLFHNEQYLSLDHHSRFSDKSKRKCLDNINQHLQKARVVLQDCKWLYLTLGTAFTFFHKQSEQVVANCHRLPADAFSKNMMEVDEIVWSLDHTIARVRELRPELQIIFTVSPVRHWREGAVANMQSKAALLTAVHQLAEQHAFVHYFPAYELMMDDLRDYRFYKGDMLHPNETAVEYIFKKFIRSSIAPDCYGAMVGIEKLHKAMSHRPRNPRSNAHISFLKHQLLFLKQLEEDWPSLSFRAERSYFETELFNHGNGEAIA